MAACSGAVAVVVAGEGDAARGGTGEGDKAKGGTTEGDMAESGTTEGEIGEDGREEAIERGLLVARGSAVKVCSGLGVPVLTAATALG
ncbi:MAG: hypothetical protein M3014_06390 [Chloroflexota bacterium]|nr:hypothetical protein [Chloroflexota bacterium]